jgi:iron complex transport system substrate-binding protein
MKLKPIMLCFALLLLFLAQSSAEDMGLIALTDDLGRVVVVSHAPEMIISLAPSNTEILFALGLGDLVVGVTKYCNYPSVVVDRKEDGTLAVVGGYKEPDVEAILTLHPDLVLASKIHSSNAIPELEEAGIPTFALNPTNFSSVFLSMAEVGKITGRDAGAMDLIGQMESLVISVSDKVGPLERKRVLYVLWHDPLQTAGKDTVQGEIIEMAGGENIFQDLSGYPLVDKESIVERNPEVIIVGTGSGDLRDSPFIWAQTDGSINQTDAGKGGRIYQVDSNLIARAGPRVVEALESVARFIHPDAF